MESKILFGKAKQEATTDFTNEIVLKEVGENDLVTVGTNDLNERDEEEGFCLKHLTFGWILSCYYSLADKNFLWACWDNFMKRCLKIII